MSNRKKRRKLCGGLCLMALVLGMGCSSQNNDSKPEITKQEHTIKWCIAGLNVEGFTEEGVITKEIEENFNDTLKKNKKEYQVEFEVVPGNNGTFTEEQEQAMQKCDIITMENQVILPEDYSVQMYPTLIDYMKEGLFAPLDDFMETDDGQRIKQKMLSEMTLESGKWNERQMLLPTALTPAIGSSLLIEKGLFEKMGWKESDEFPDFTKCDEIFQKIYEQLGETPFLTFSDEKRGSGVNGNIYDIPQFLEEIQNNYGIYQVNDAGIGAAISSGTDLDTSNILSADYMESVLNAWNRYIEKGYVNTDTSEQPLVQMAGNYFGVDESEISGKVYLSVRPQEYALHITKQQGIPLDPFTGISSKSENKDLAFEVLADMITDETLHKALKEVSPDQTVSLVFETGYDEEEEERYKEIIKTAPTFEIAHQVKQINTPEVQAVRKVFLDYCKETDQATANPLMRYFSENGEVTSESIKKGLDAWNQKLEKAGMSNVLEQIKELKEQEVAGE